MSSSKRLDTSPNKTDDLLSKMLDILKSLQSKQAEIKASNKWDDSSEPCNPSPQKKFPTRIGPCRYCKKPGHWIEGCRKRKFNNQRNRNYSESSSNSRDTSADVPQSTESIKTAATSSTKQENSQ